ncbi:energy transducer TonB [Membranihabitans marinus]|uniref:energy transducer TonB n=1 Tax=Membranihabitans marinus TaxID=1227546 RepID=UPI001F00DD23|nr:energy transducer TonB [Membranihabitans marinus]
MITYLSQLTICWMIVYIAYHLFLKRETFFKYNRWYLLSGLILGIVIPLIDWSTLFQHKAESLTTIYLAPVNYQIESWDIATRETQMTWWQITLLAIYGLGVLVTSIKLFKGIHEIYALRKGAKISSTNGHQLVLTQQLHMPFSFLNAIYWTEFLYESSNHKERIMAHEIKHVSSWHSVDILFIELLCIVFWFHPMVFLYRKEIKEVHEYEADEAACLLGSKKEYGQLLLNQAQSNLQLSLANHFIYSQLKNRFKMMTRKPSNQKAMLKYLVAIPIFAFAALLFSFTQGQLQTPVQPNMAVDSIPPLPLIGEKIMSRGGEYVIQPTDILYVNGQRIGQITNELMQEYSKKGPWRYYGTKAKDAKAAFGTDITTGLVILSRPIKEIELTEAEKADTKLKGEVFKIVEQMPMFPGCEDIDLLDRKRCADTKMLDFLYNNLKYPSEAKDKNITGNAVISFVVETDGSLSTFKAIRDPGAGLADEAIRVAKLMNNLDQNWTPGLQRGNKVRVQFLLPVKFSLEDEESDNQEDQIAVYIDGQRHKVAPSSEIDDIIHADQIESISVFKDPATLAKYGEKNVDGMVFINTKSAANTESSNFPYLAECSDLSTASAKRICSEKKLINLILRDVRYPKTAIENNIHGTVVATFTVKKNREISEVTIIRDPGAGLGDEVARTIESVMESGEWNHNIISDLPEDLTLTIPVKFQIEGLPPKPSQNRSLMVNPIQELVVVSYPQDNKSSTTLKNQINPNAKPLVVVDGKTKNIENKAFEPNDVSPDQIQSINVLKGQNAIDKYGSIAKDGAIEITTKNLVNEAEKPILELDDLQIYPNPSTVELNVQFKTVEPGEYQIKLLDIQGKVLQTREETISNQANIHLDLSGIKAGNYYLIIEHENQRLSKMFVKQ